MVAVYLDADSAVADGDPGDPVMAGGRGGVNAVAYGDADVAMDGGDPINAPGPQDGLGVVVYYG